MDEHDAAASEVLTAIRWWGRARRMLAPMLTGLLGAGAGAGLVGARGGREPVDVDDPRERVDGRERVDVEGPRERVDVEGPRERVDVDDPRERVDGRERVDVDGRERVDVDDPREARDRERDALEAASTDWCREATANARQAIDYFGQLAEHCELPVEARPRARGIVRP